MARRGLGALGLRLVASAALMLAVASPAAAQWREDGRHAAGQERGGRSGGWRAPPQGYGAGRRDEGPRYAAPRYAAPRYDPMPGSRYGRSAYEGLGFAPPPRVVVPGGGGYGGRAWRRGEVLPDGYRGAAVPEPGRYHLRRAPNGYDWVGDDRNAYLVQRSTGMVLDSVPGAYDPPPPYRGRRP